MKNKVVLILVDGMRPDAMMNCGNPFADRFVKASSHALNAGTVMPSVTLPCHMSLFLSVDPDRHGILTNTYVPQVRPIVGLIDQLDTFGKKCTFFNSWEELRDISRPGRLFRYSLHNIYKEEHVDDVLTDEAIEYIKAEEPDFLFLYLGETDEVGHHHGWMGENYLACVSNALRCIEKVYENLPEGYTLITTADHGGHGRRHGENIPEDMTIPIVLNGPQFEKDKALADVTIKDLAPTIAKLLDVPAVPDWEGKALI